MEIKQYDVVLLRNGLKAQVVEVLGGGECCVVDVEEAHGWDEDDTIFAMTEEIIANFETWKEADRFRRVIGIEHLEIPGIPGSFTFLVFEERIPAGWRKLIINGTEYKPVFASGLKSDMLAIEGTHDCKGMTVEFV